LVVSMVLISVTVILFLPINGRFGRHPALAFAVAPGYAGAIKSAGDLFFIS
jgi:hypothetical protein